MSSQKSLITQTPLKHLALAAPNWIGDCVMAQPAMRACVEYLQPQQITVYGKAWLPQLLPFLGLDLIDSNDCNNVMVADEPPNDADAVILFPNSFRSARAAQVAKIGIRIGFSTQWRRLLLTHAHKPRLNTLNEHHREYFLDLAEQQGIVIGERQVRLHVRGSNMLLGEKLAQSFGLQAQRMICIAPGASFGNAKCYPAEKYAQIATALAQDGWHILALGNEDEVEVASQVLAGIPTGQAANACGETSLTEAICLLAVSRLLLCNDSGLMHIAAGISKQVIAIFGATDPKRTAPSGKLTKVIYEPAECSPCLKRECKTIGQPCMNTLSVEKIIKRCRKQLRC
ncbi:MAG: lipopolysaccharide heptosyltransferase II [Mariprofundales bacterium]